MTPDAPSTAPAFRTSAGHADDWARRFADETRFGLEERLAPTSGGALDALQGRCGHVTSLEPVAEEARAGARAARDHDGPNSSISHQHLVVSQCRNSNQAIDP